MSKDIEIRGGGRSIGKSYQADIAIAQRYREYMSNNAYIPLQDIPLYQKSFEKYMEEINYVRINRKENITMRILW